MSYYHLGNLKNMGFYNAFKDCRWYPIVSRIIFRTSQGIQIWSPKLFKMHWMFWDNSLMKRFRGL